MVLEWPSFSTCASDPGRGVPTTVLCPQCCGNGAAARRQVSVSTPVPLSQRSDMVVFLNGEFIPADQARVGVMTHALSYGTGCFEGIRAYWNEQAGENYIFRVREHFERLHRSCRITMTELPYSVDDLIEISTELIRRNNLRENTYL